MSIISVESLNHGVVYGLSGIPEVIQNVQTILTTRKGTVPLNRNFGVSFDFLDNPTPQAQAKLSVEIFEGIKKYEPRAILKEVIFNVDPMAGQIKPCVKIDVRL